MLNLFDPINYTIEEKAHVDSVLKLRSKAVWKDQKGKTKAIKNRISEHTIIAQGGRCAYCETPLARGAHEIEHIAPKSVYGEFCFEPFNLVTVCSSCNSTSNKGKKDTIVSPANRRDYCANRFKIVHPYLDNPDDHFKFLDEERAIFDIPNCSPEAQATIAMFDWNKTWAYNQRIRNAITKDLPIDVLRLVTEIVTYKI